MMDREGIWKKLRTAFYALLALTVFAAAGISAYMESLLNEIDRVPEATPETVAIEKQTENDVTLTTSGKDSKTVVTNILLVGQDRRAGEKKNGRSDAMILCTVNRRTKTVTLTSFMRDLYVKIPGKKNNRINAAYAIGGIKLLDQCLEENFGVQVDGNVVVDFQAFMKAVDLVGGVDVELTGKEAAYLNSATYRDQARWESDLLEGINHLNGNSALAYARNRKISGNDFGRTKRQRKVLEALLEKVSNLTLPEIHRLLKTLLGEVSTDISNTKILGYAMEFLSEIKNYQIKTQQIPEEGTYRNVTIDGMQVLLPDLEKNRDILSGIIA